jgi:hypothetical protein|tara:strand:- start:476 stop:577 length:102 start_codon:yes stop_codon:yes gene_type:complete
LKRPRSEGFNDLEAGEKTLLVELIPDAAQGDQF